MNSKMADIARAEFAAINRRRNELRKDIRLESDWQRYRIVIHPELLKAIGDLFTGDFFGWYISQDAGRTPETLLGIPIVRDPNVEGWLLRDVCDEIARRNP